MNADFYGDFWKDVPGQDEIKEYLNKGGDPSHFLGKGSELATAKGYVGLGSAEEKYFVPAYNFYKNLKDVVTKLNAASNNSYTYDINIQGFASSQGYNNSNVILAENRALSIENWIKELNIFDFGGKDTISHNGNGQINETGGLMDSESGFKPKAARTAVVTFKITSPEKVITEEQVFDDIDIVEEREVQETNVTVESHDEFDTSESDDYKNDTYDNEYTYFKRINEEDDMVKRYISDKVDYFDPAFQCKINIPAAVYKTRSDNLGIRYGYGKCIWCR